MFFEYGEREIAHLKFACAKLGAAIEEAGMLRRRVEPEIFKGLISGIVSQQISTKAAATVFVRLEELVGEITPESILAKSDEEVKSCGLSYRKVGYIKGVCEAVTSGDLDLDRLCEVEDEAVIQELVKLSGIGVWSAEMLLLFSFRRPDILSYGDLVIRKGIMKLYDLEELSKKDFEKYRKQYSPYGSVASLYLWNLAND